MYHSSKQYTTDYPYGNRTYDARNFHGQRYNSMMAMNFENKMNDRNYPINNLNYTLGSKPNNMYTYDIAKANANIRRNSYRLPQKYETNDASESNYTTHKRSKTPSYQSVSTKSRQLESRASFSSNEGSGNSEKSIYMNNTRGNNVYHITCNGNEKKENGKYEKRGREREREKSNSICSKSNYDYGGNQHISIHSKPNYQDDEDCEDISVNEGGATFINININGNMNGNIAGYDSEEETEYDDSNEIYDDQSANIYNQMMKPKKPRKVFMGAYYISDLKKKLLTPLHICGPHPTLIAPNPNVFCYGITPKEKERNRKPEIVVRY